MLVFFQKNRFYYFFIFSMKFLKAKYDFTREFFPGIRKNDWPEFPEKKHALAGREKKGGG